MLEHLKEIASVVAQLGFPVVCCGVLLYATIWRFPAELARSAREIARSIEKGADQQARMIGSTMELHLSRLDEKLADRTKDAAAKIHEKLDDVLDEVRRKG